MRRPPLMKMIYSDGKPVHRGVAVTPDHYRSAFYIHNTGLEAMKRAKDRVQEQFKVLFIKGEVMCIEHTFYNPYHVAAKVRRLISRPTTHIETTCVVRR